MHTAPTYSRPPFVSAEEEAYQYLLDGICRGKFRIGDRLIAEEIANEINMSRMPIRGAFKRLAAEGLITLRPNRGAIISGLNLEEMCEIFEMRSVLEGLAIRVAVPKVTNRHLTRLELLLDEMDECREDGAEWVSRHRAFHEYLYSISGRPRLMRQISALYSVIELHMRLWLRQIDKPLSAREEHSAILEALQSGNPEHAEQVLREHIEGTVPALSEFLKRSGASDPNSAARPLNP